MPKNIFYACRSFFAFLFSFIPAPVIEPLFRFFAKSASNAENNAFAWNGEERLIARFTAGFAGNPPAVYDIGANIGAWSAEILKRSPEAYVYAFEMIPAFAEKAAARLKPYRNARVLNAPLSNENRGIEAFQHGGGAAISGNKFHAKELTKHALKTRIGDEFVTEEKLLPPDFIKIDVDGHELKVLQGLKETLQKARPFIQFEYSFYYVQERAYLKDIFELLGAMNYDFYQIFPTKLVKRAYKPALENFWTANYLACPREKSPP